MYNTILEEKVDFMQANKLVVGLGNPGKGYENTRHNAGFVAVDWLAGEDAVWAKEKNALVYKKFTEPPFSPQSSVIFVKPQTFMNLSGEAVRDIMKFYKIPIENLVVVHDDMDIKIGDIREKIGGGSAGHNGIKSIDALVGNNYRRIRIGVGHPRDSQSPIPPSDWVLGKFSTSEMEKLMTAIKSIAV